MAKTLASSNRYWMVCSTSSMEPLWCTLNWRVSVVGVRAWTLTFTVPVPRVRAGVYREHGRRAYIML